jgi:hypothetical protein
MRRDGSRRRGLLARSARTGRRPGGEVDLGVGPAPRPAARLRAKGSKAAGRARPGWGGRDRRCGRS